MGDPNFRIDQNSNNYGFTFGNFQWNMPSCGFFSGGGIFDVLMQKTFWDMKTGNGSPFFNFCNPTPADNPWGGNWGWTPSYAGSSSVSSSGNGNKPKTDAEKLAQIKLERNFDKLKDLLNDFKANCSQDLQDEIGLELDKYSAKTQENYNKLKALYDKYKTDIQEWFMTENPKMNEGLLKAGLANDSATESAANTLVTEIKNNDSVQYSDFTDYQILELLSHENLVKEITTKYKKDGTPDAKKTSLEGLADTLKKQLLAETDLLLNTTNRHLDNETKETLKSAKNELTGASLKENAKKFQTKFEDLYVKLRLAEAKVLAAKTQEEYGFLEDEDFFEKKIVDDAKKDLEEEQLDSKIGTSGVTGFAATSTEGGETPAISKEEQKKKTEALNKIKQTMGDNKESTLEKTSHNAYISIRFGVDDDGNINLLKNSNNNTSQFYNNYKNELYKLVSENLPNAGIDSATFDKLFQAAWINMLGTELKQKNRTWGEPAEKFNHKIIEKVYDNLQQAISTYVNNPDLGEIYLKHTAFKDSELTNNLKNYNSTTIINYKGIENTNDGIRIGTKAEDTGTVGNELFQETINELLLRLQEKYKAIGDENVKDLLKKALQESNLKEVLMDNFADCPDGTSVIARGYSRAGDRHKIRMDQLIELVLYNFDKKLYEYLGNPD